MPVVVDSGHELISGTIGMGKSYWVLYKIVKSFEADRPCCYIDPKGDTYRNLLAFFAATSHGQRLWRSFGHRILFLNPVSPCGYIVGFNALEPMRGFQHAAPDPVALLANSLTSHIRKQSGFEISEAMRMQNVLAAGIGTLVEAGCGYTLREIPSLFVQPPQPTGKYRQPEPFNPLVRSLLPGLQHIGTRSFWREQWANWTPVARREWVQSTEGRIFQYLFDEHLLCTVCTSEHSRLDFRRLVDQGIWLFVNIPYPLLSDTVTTVLGNLLITNIFYACMQRPPSLRPYRLILDEARFFNTGPLDMLLETSRAYRLWLTVVVQSLEQLARAREGYIDWHLRETAINNVRYWASFHNAVDKQLLADLMFPVTGQKVIGVRKSGDSDYQPVVAEQNENQRRFIELQHREVLLWDKWGRGPQLWQTPSVVMHEPRQERLDRFEAEHLRATGVPEDRIRQEILERQARIELILNPPQPARRVAKAQFGGQL